MVSLRTYGIVFLFLLFGHAVTAQQADSTQTESVVKQKQRKVRDPKKAALFSAVAPGGGQIYNGRFWKLPFVYGALGTVTYLYFDNRSIYREFRAAYINDLNFEDPDYEPSIYAAQNIQASTLRAKADEARLNMEYCIIGFAAVYALQIIDATVDAHLSSFDVDDDLSLDWHPTIQPAFQPGKPTGMMTGFNLNFRF